MGSDLLAEVPLLYQAILQGHMEAQVSILPLILLRLRCRPINPRRRLYHRARPHYIPQTVRKVCWLI